MPYQCPIKLSISSKLSIHPILMSKLLMLSCRTLIMQSIQHLLLLPVPLSTWCASVVTLAPTRNTYNTDSLLPRSTIDPRHSYDYTFLQRTNLLLTVVHGWQKFHLPMRVQANNDSRLKMETSIGGSVPSRSVAGVGCTYSCRSSFE